MKLFKNTNLWKAKILYPSEAHGRLLKQIWFENCGFMINIYLNWKNPPKKRIKKMSRLYFINKMFEFLNLVLNSSFSGYGSPDHGMMERLLKGIHPTLLRNGKCQVSHISKPIGGSGLKESNFHTFHLNRMFWSVLLPVLWVLAKAIW